MKHKIGFQTAQGLQQEQHTARIYVIREYSLGGVELLQFSFALATGIVGLLAPPLFPAQLWILVILSLASIAISFYRLFLGGR